MFVSLARLCVVYVVKEVASLKERAFWALRATDKPGRFRNC